MQPASFPRFPFILRLRTMLPPVMRVLPLLALLVGGASAAQVSAGVSAGLSSGMSAQTPAQVQPRAEAEAPKLTTACAETDAPVTRETLVPTMREAWALVNAKHRAAVRCYERLVPAAEAFGDARQKAYAHDGFAWALSQAERRAEARRVYARAVTLYREIGDEANAARALRNLGASQIHANDHAAARASLEEALAIFTRLGLARDEAIALEHLTYAFDTEGPEKDALRARGLDAARRGKQEEAACGIYHEWGDSLFVRGRYGEAVSHLTEASACFERVKETEAQGRVLVSLGRVQRAHGQLRSALRYYERALNLQQRGGHTLAAVQSLNAIAVTYGYLEQSDEALRYYDQALALAKTVPSPENVAFITGQIGSELMRRGDFARAVPMLEAAIHGDLSPLHLTFRWSQIGLAYARAGRRAEAIAAADRAVESARGIGPDALMPALSNRSGTRQLLGLLDAAQADLTEAMTLVETLRANTIALDFMKRGFGQQHQQLYARAIDLQMQRGRPQAALEAAEQARARAFLDLLASRAKPSARLSSPAAPAAPAAVVDASDAGAPASAGNAAGATAGGDGANVAVAGAPVTMTASGARAAADAITAAETRDPGAATPALRAARSTLAAEVAAEVEAAEGAQRRTLDSEVTVAAPTLDDVRATARRLRSTLLVYWVGDNATHIWVVSPAGRIQAARVDITRARLHDLVAAATRSTEAAAAGVASFGSTTKPWRDLYQVAIAPVRAHLPTAANSLLTIVPHGPLFQVSFAALQDERGRYLLERYRLHYTPAIGVLSFTSASRAAAVDGARDASALLVGDPLPLTPQPGEDPMPPLPWAKREVDEIGAALSSSRPSLLTRQAASEASVRARIEQAGLLHFATHGVVQQEESLASFLALADGARAPHAESDGGGGEEPALPLARSDDGRLTADEVYGLHLRAQLVVLSACRTALGPLSGDGVIGFTRAFLYAGAPSVVATSWDVPDEAGYELMRRFYQSRGTVPASGAAASGATTAVAPRPTDTADALRAAQLSVLRALRNGSFTVATATGGRTAPREHPLFWAGFLLVGEP